MTDKKIAAGNDNAYVHRFFRYKNGESGDRLDLMKHIPLARTLIKKYSTRPYKHSPDHPDFTFLEYQLCTILERPVESPVQRYLQVSDIAWVLEISPLILINEPLLLFAPTDLARFP